MNPAATAILEPKIRGLLLLQKSENVIHNVLAALGLFPVDFPDHPSLQIMWDADEIVIQSKTMEKDPKWAALLRHSNLVDIDGDEVETTWTFQWPREIATSRNALMARFPELSQDSLWKNFQKSWAGITDKMPAPRYSLVERETQEGIGDATDLEAAVKILDFSDDPDFSDDLGFEEPVEAQETLEDGEGLVPGEATDAPQIEDEGSAFIVETIAGMGSPAVETAMQAAVGPMKKKRGRPFGTTKAAKAQAQELSATDFVFKEEVSPEGAAKKSIPACVKFAAIAEEELSRLRSVAESIKNAEVFPVEAVRGFKSSLDRLALRSAHMEFKGRHDAEDDTGGLNPMVEVTLCNVTAVLNVASRDLALAPEKPLSWETFGKSIKDALDVAKSFYEVISQTGMGPIVQELPKPKDAQGGTLTT